MENILENCYSEAAFKMAGQTQYSYEEVDDFLKLLPNDFFKIKIIDEVVALALSGETQPNIDAILNLKNGMAEEILAEHFEIPNLEEVKRVFEIYNNYHITALASDLNVTWKTLAQCLNKHGIRVREFDEYGFKIPKVIISETGEFVFSTRQFFRENGFDQETKNKHKFGKRPLMENYKEFAKEMEELKCS